MYLIDTNILRGLKDGKPQIINMFRKNKEKIFLSDIVAFEVYYGAKKVNSTGLIKFYNKVFSYYKCLNYNYEQAIMTADVKNNLAKKGRVIEDLDLMIACQALYYDFTLVTDNTKHFERIEGLKLENWLE